MIIFCTSNWRNREEADRKTPELKSWFLGTQEHMNTDWPKDRLFVACGSYSDRTQLGVGVDVVNSGMPASSDYDVRFNNLFLCAFEAALWHFLLSCTDQDILVELESDVSVRKDTNLRAIIEEFQKRPELLMAPRWHTHPDQNFCALKREGVVRFLHHRRRGNIVEGGTPPLPEEELGQIFAGKWWNPWPHLWTIRQDSRLKDRIEDSIAVKWPICRMASDRVKQVWKV